MIKVVDDHGSIDKQHCYLFAKSERVGEMFLERWNGL
jgi:hypothetical protein